MRLVYRAQQKKQHSNTDPKQRHYDMIKTYSTINVKDVAHMSWQCSKCHGYQYTLQQLPQLHHHPM